MTATGAVLKLRQTPRSTVSRNLNVVGTTAGAPAIDAESQSLHTRPALVGVANTKPSDYLLIAGLIVALLILVREG
jgi:hypothetical protein